MRKKELEAKVEKLEKAIKDIRNQGLGLPNRLLECIEITDFLLRNNKENIEIKPILTDKGYSACFKVRYVYDARVETRYLENFNANFYGSWKVVKNDDEFAILSVLYSPLTIKSETRYYKFNKKTGDIVEVTDLIPAKEDWKKAGENLVNAVSSLASIFEPKTAKNVKKDTEKPAKNVGKKTTKKKESKNGKTKTGKLGK